MGALLGEPGRGLLYWGTRRICIARLWRRAFFSMGALLGNLDGGSFTRDLCTDDGFGDGYFSPSGPCWGKGGSIYRNFEI